MKKYLVCTGNEWTKLIHKKKYIVFLLIGVFLSMFNILGKLLISKLIGGSLSFISSGTSMSMITLFINFLIPLISMMAVCDLFSTEFQDQTIKAVLLRPISRFKIYIAKITAVTLMALLYIVVLFIASTLLDALINRETKGLLYSAGAYLIDIIPMIIVILMAAFINQLTKGSTMAMFLCIIIYMLLYIIGIFVPSLSGLLFTGYIKWHTIWLGHMLPPGAMLSKTALLAGYALIFISGGYWLFMRHEI